jgi:hypothetical protein
MCYDLEASIKSSIIGVLSCYILYNSVLNVKKHSTYQMLALFFLFVTLMQIYDWIFWETLKDNNGKNKTNYIFTKIAMITNHLQPIVLAYLINRVHPLNDISKLIVGLYTLSALIYSIYVFYKIDYTVVSKKSTPTLDWQWNSEKYSSLFYGLFLLSFTLISYNLIFPLNLLMILINTGTFLFSYHVYKNGTLGKGWCTIAAYVPLLLVMMEMVVDF